MSKIGTIFKDIVKPFAWVGKEIVNLPKALDKLITLSNDAKEIASDAAAEVIAVSTDVGNLVAAVEKDDGASLQAIEELLSSSGQAIADKGINFVEDAAAVAAAEKFFATINGTNYADVLLALAKVIADGKSMTSVVIQDFKKLGADVTA